MHTAEPFVQVFSMLDFVIFSVFWGSSLSQIQGRVAEDKHFSAPQCSDSSA